MKVDTDREYVAERNWKPRRLPIERRSERRNNLAGLFCALGIIFAVMAFGAACYLFLCLTGGSPA